MKTRTKISKRDAKAEEQFQAIMRAVRDLYKVVTATRPAHAKHILRRMERVVYEVNDCPDDAEFGSWCLNELDVLDAARLRLTADHDLPHHEHSEICHRFAVADVAAGNGVTIDPTFTEGE